MPDPLDGPENPVTTTAEDVALASPVDDETLVSLIGVSVLAVDGVTRLEPTLTSLFRASLPGSSGGLAGPDGVRLTSFGAISDVTVDVATAAGHQSRDVAESVQRVIHGLLDAHGREAGRVRVNVLTIDQGS